MARPLETFATLVLEHVDAELAAAHRELYPELRATMHALWALYPEHPPYGEPGGDPPPHATLGRLEGPHAITLEQARARVEPLLPVRCEVREATLMEEEEPDRCRVRATFPLGTALLPSV